MSGLHISSAVNRVALFCMLATGAALGQFGTRPNGESLTELAPTGTRAVALFFVASDCPISDRTFPEMKRLRESFAARGVKFWFVYPNSTESVTAVEAHQRDFDPSGEILLDRANDLVHLTHVRVTPEVSILVPDGRNAWKIIYSGRIDDRFVHLGEERPHPSEYFAEQAIEAALVGRPAPPATGAPVGCGIIGPAIVPAQSNARSKAQP